ncbi:MAG: PD-(D/E)XK nuclease family transposase [Cyclobacteriaceae bacterium]|nr:PD-(D/E)XK nuclease family transposase [Cyclobacteriaceae bacterium]
MRSRYINPFTDFGFKKIFGSTNAKEILIDFLNQVLGGEEEIQDLTYHNLEKLGNSKSDRSSIFDIYCTNNKGERFIIELQNASQRWLKDRSIFYATYAIQEQSVKGKSWDYELKATYTIVIMNFPLMDGDPRYHKVVKLMDTHTHKVFFDKLCFVYLEIPNFALELDELNNDFDRWIYVLKHMHRLQDLPDALKSKIFKKVFEIAEIANLTREEMKTYNKSQKASWDNYALLESAKMEGREEVMTTMVIKLFKAGVSLDKISEASGLSMDELKIILDKNT